MGGEPCLQVHEYAKLLAIKGKEGKWGGGGTKM